LRIAHLPPYHGVVPHRLPMRAYGADVGGFQTLLRQQQMHHTGIQPGQVQTCLLGHVQFARCGLMQGQKALTQIGVKRNECVREPKGRCGTDKSANTPSTPSSEVPDIRPMNSPLMGLY